MNQQEEQAFAQMQQENQELQSQIQGGQTSQQQQSVMMQEQEKNLLKDQLDLTEEFERLQHFLRGEVLVITDGVAEWKVNEDLVMLSEAGVNYCLLVIQSYLTKNTLLSNFDDETIQVKMEDISTTIADTLFMKYDTYFKHPTNEEIEQEIENKIDKRVKMKLLHNKLNRIESNEEEIKKAMEKEMGMRIEKEYKDIKEGKIKDKLKLYDSILRVIQDSIHSTYNRAWRGGERTSIRKHIHVTETVGRQADPYDKGRSRWKKN